MPLVLLKKDGKRFNREPGKFLLWEMVNKLPSIIADALSVPGTEGELTASEVEVYVSDFGPLDIHNQPVEIVVFANEYPERLANLKERRDKITGKLKGFSIIEQGYSLWLNLIKGTYAEFPK